MGETDTHIVLNLKKNRDVLNAILKELKSQKRISPIAVGGGGGTVINVDTTLLATELTLAAVLAKILTAPSTEAKQDDIISKLSGDPSTEDKQDVQIAENAANFALNIAQMATQTALNILAIAASTAATLVGNSTLSDIDDALRDGGNSAAELLTTIDEDTNQIRTNTGSTAVSSNTTATNTTTIAARLISGPNSAATLLDTIADQLLNSTGEIDLLEIPNNNNDIEARPNINQSEQLVVSVDITNNHPTFPVIFSFFRTDGATEHLLFSTASISAGASLLVTDLEIRLQRNLFLVIRSSIDGGATGLGHAFEVAAYGEKGSGNMVLTSPT